MTHIGPRVGALVDGQMSSAEEERAWGHVQECADCQAAVARESWIKRQLAYLSTDAGVAPSALKGSLCQPSAFAAYPDLMPQDERSRRFAGLAAIGAGSVGAAMFGVLALSAAPAEAPVMERRAPVSSLVTTPNVTPKATPRRDRDAATVMKLVTSTWVRMGL